MILGYVGLTLVTKGIFLFFFVCLQIANIWLTVVTCWVFQFLFVHSKMQGSDFCLISNDFLLIDIIIFKGKQLCNYQLTTMELSSLNRCFFFFLVNLYLIKNYSEWYDCTKNCFILLEHFQWKKIKLRCDVLVYLDIGMVCKHTESYFLKNKMIFYLYYRSNVWGGGIT